MAQFPYRIDLEISDPANATEATASNDTVIGHCPFSMCRAKIVTFHLGSESQIISVVQRGTRVIDADAGLRTSHLA